MSAADDVLGQIEESERAVALELAGVIQAKTTLEEVKADVLEFAKVYGPKIAALALHLAFGL